MNLSSAACYRAVQARDPRYDGRFFTCVKSTGIYCRPICPARPPKLENCAFVATAAAAQEAGFRPCLRCRPESSPDLDAWRGTSATVSHALRMIEAGALDEGDVPGLAARLGIGGRHLRRLFLQHLGAAPVTVAQTRRILLARQLLHQTDLPMIEVALASGFGSVRRFNETFQALYQRPPGALRGGRASRASATPGLTLLLPYHPPYDWEAMIGFLGRRAIAGVEVVEDGIYSRVIRMGEAAGFLSVAHAPEHCALRVTVNFPRLPALPAIIARVRRMFDLSTDVGAIGGVLAADPVLEPLVTARPGLRVPGAWDGFEAALRAVLGQQITVTAAVRLASRMVAEADVKVETPVPGLSHAFPEPEDLGAFVFTGMPRARADSLAGLVRAACADRHLFDPRSGLDAAVRHLCRLPGVGAWTAHYIAMRAMGESDAFLAADVGVQKGFATRSPRLNAGELLARAEQWRPWRAYAVQHLWMAAQESTDQHTKP